MLIQLATQEGILFEKKNILPLVSRHSGQYDLNKN